MPNQPNTTTALLDVWREVLKPNDNDDLKLVSNIGLISSAMLKLEGQIAASQTLQLSYKSAAAATISQLRQLLMFSKFNTNAYTLRGFCSSIQHGTLGMIGLALKSEFSEPRLEPVDANELKQALLEVKELLKDTSIALDLRYDLETQIDQMMLWLNDLDIVSSSELYEKVGAATFTAKLISDSDDKPSNESAAQKIAAKCAGVASRMIAIMNTGSKVIDGLSQLDTSAHHFLSLPPL